MGLFGFGKKKEEKEPTCACNAPVEETKEESCCCCGSNSADAETENCCCAGESVECVKVLGAGCKSCHELYENTKEAVKNAGLSVEVEYITDMEKIMGYGIMSMPGLVINEQIASAGKVLKTAEVEKLLQKFM